MPRFSTEQEGTPCPIRSSNSEYRLNQGNQQPQTSFPLAALDDDEEIDDLDYTRALPDDFQLFPNRAVKRRAVLHEPPRRMTGWASLQTQPQQRKSDQQRQADENENARVPEPNFHVDVISALQPQQQTRGQGLHQQPRRMGGIGMARKIETKNRRRISTMLAARKSQSQNAALQEQLEAPTPISTLIQSIHPEQASRKAMLGDKTRSVSNSQPNPIFEANPTEKKPMIEKNHLFAPPKRGPLQAPSRFLNQPGIDVVGRANSGGKENIPPGRSSILGDVEKRVERRIAACGGTIPAPGKFSSGNMDKSKMAPPGRPPPIQSNQPQRFARESLKRRSESMVLDDEDMSFISSGSTPPTADSENTSQLASDRLRLLKRRKLGMQLPPTPPALSKDEEAELQAMFAPPKDLLPPGASFHHFGDKRSRQELNPVLREELIRTEMYEDSWLLAQESSVSQLLNSILSDKFLPSPVPSDTIMRKDFLRIYASAPFPLLFKRLQASLLYGALSVPKDILGKSSSAKLGGSGVGLSGQGWGWAEDVAVRKKFLALFFECYDLSGLVAGLEVVVGREMFSTPCKNAVDKRKCAEVFLERYLMKCEDALACPPLEDTTKGRGGQANNSHGDNEDWGSPAWLLRKSLLRSLMLILLMDKAKAQGALGRLRLFMKVRVPSSMAIWKSF